MLISVEQTPSRLLPASFPPELVLQVDAVSHPPTASTSAAPLPAHLVDWKGEGGGRRLQEIVVKAVESALKASESVLVVLDSIDALAEEGTYEALSVVKAVLSRLNPHKSELYCTPWCVHARARHGALIRS